MVQSAQQQDQQPQHDEGLEFLAKYANVADISARRNQIDSFLLQQVIKQRKCVIVTSGGTTVPLERNTVRYITNFSVGTRGARSTEEFIKQGYAVIYLHAKSAVRPFRRDHIHLNAHDFEFNEATQQFVLKHASAKQQQERIETFLMLEKIDKEQLLLEVVYDNVYEYLLLFEASATCLQQCGTLGMYYAASAVSDFFIPWEELSQHKIQSKDGGLDLQLKQVPKMLHLLKGKWCPSAFCISFKLETDENIINDKVSESFKKYKMNAICSNLLQNYNDVMWINEPTMTKQIKLVRDDAMKAQHKTLEILLIPKLVELHDAYIAANK